MTETSGFTSEANKEARNLAELGREIEDLAKGFPDKNLPGLSAYRLDLGDGSYVRLVHNRHLRSTMNLPSEFIVVRKTADKSAKSEIYKWYDAKGAQLQTSGVETRVTEAEQRQQIGEWVDLAKAAIANTT